MRFLPIRNRSLLLIFLAAITLGAPVRSFAAEAKDKPSQFFKTFKSLLAFVNSSAGETMLENAVELRDQVDQQIEASTEPLKKLNEDIREIQKEGDIDVSLTYAEYYDLLARKAEAAIGGAGGRATADAATSMKGQLESVEIDAGALNSLAADFEKKVTSLKSDASKVGDGGGFGSGLSASAMKGKLSSYINSLRAAAGEESGPIVVALALALEEFSASIDKRPNMRQKELDTMANTVKRLAEAAKSEIGKLASLYENAAKKLRDAAKKAAAGKVGEAETIVTELEGSLESAISAGEAKEGAAPGVIAQLEAEAAEYLKGLLRLIKFRDKEDEIIAIQKPICDMVDTIEKTQNPSEVFKQLDNEYVDILRAYDPPISKDMAKAAKVDNAVTKASTKAANAVANNAPPPGSNTMCGGLYVKPIGPDTPAFGSPLDGNFPGFNPPKIDQCGFGGCDKGKKKKSSKPVLRTKADRRAFKAAKEFLKDKKQRIRDAYRRAYNAEMVLF